VTAQASLILRFGCLAALRCLANRDRNPNEQAGRNRKKQDRARDVHYRRSTSLRCNHPKRSEDKCSDKADNESSGHPHDRSHEAFSDKHDVTTLPRYGSRLRIGCRFTSQDALLCRILQPYVSEIVEPVASSFGLAVTRHGFESRRFHFPSQLFSLQQHHIEKSKTEQGDTEQTVGCEKGGVEPLQTVATKQQVLIHQEARGKEDAGQIETTQI
jgi:hypothetical protein